MALGPGMLISDKQSRLKPCLRCGYPLRGAISARNCPECGLAVRISLSDNRGLEWSNPRWQRSLALAFVVLALGLFCTMLSSAADWLAYAAFENYFELDDLTFTILERIYTHGADLSSIACGAALCLMSKPEGRYPDDSRVVRRIMMGTGIIIVVLGLVRALGGHGQSFQLPHMWNYYLWKCLSGPWIPLMLTVFAGGAAIEIGRRGYSKLLSKMSRLPVYPVAGGMVAWLFGFKRFFWPLRSIVWEWLYPLSMLAMLAVMIRVLLQGAREAEQNWITDP
jgi:hypothetical protein